MCIIKFYTQQRNWIYDNNNNRNNSNNNNNNGGYIALFQIWSLRFYKKYKIYTKHKSM